MKVIRKNSTIQRLNIIKGQIDGLTRLIEQKEDCHKVIGQLYAVNVALKKTIETYLQENISSCLKTIDLDSKETIDFLLKEIIKNG